MFVVLNWPISSNNKSVVLFTFTHLINGSTVLCVGLGGYAFMHHHPVCVWVCGVVHVCVWGGTYGNVALVTTAL